jgi:hypothetical protein
MVEKKLPSSIELQRQLIEPDHPNLSVRRQCERALPGWKPCYPIAENSLAGAASTDQAGSKIDTGGELDFPTQQEKEKGIAD